MSKFKLNGEIYSFSEEQAEAMAIFMEKNAGKFEPVAETEEISEDDENVARVRADNFVAQNYSTEDDAVEYNKIDTGAEDFVIDYDKKINPKGLKTDKDYAKEAEGDDYEAFGIAAATLEGIDDTKDAFKSFLVLEIK